MAREDATREQRALRLLEEALERPTGERQAFVEDATAPDAALRDEVLRLLSLAEEDDDLPPLVATARRPAARTLGPYRLIARIGAGGMGEVWRAERADGAFHREVAVKLLRQDVAGDELLDRFVRERQVQAALAHPGIAQLLDGGEDENGVPYLVLEYVDGRPIDEHCRRHGLDDRARLALFLDVCAAVAHAHGRGVVHRDLKPSNVLVGEDGRPRLLDFGIARVLDPTNIAPGLDVTQGTFRMMTPAYASPEQLRYEPATTASDQYALGVLLYELLTGRLPFDLDGRSPAEVERVVTHDEPTRPSAVRRDRPLDGDLDWIVLRALRKEPRRRYASVDELAGDVRRFLRGEPVRARPDTTAYRVSKFVRRYPVPVTLAVLLFVALSAGIVASLHQLRRANASADAARVARAEADRKREESETVTRFLADMIADAAPGGRVDREATIRDALDAAARELDRRDWTGRAPLEARLRLEVGRSYEKLGAYAAARPHLERAVSLVRSLPPPRDELWAAAIAAQTALSKAEQRFPEAEALARELLAFREESGDPAARLSALNDLAGIVRSQDRLDEARPLFVEAIEGFERLGGSPELCQVLNNLGVLENQAGRPSEAVPLLERAIALSDVLHGGADPLPPVFRANLARALGSLGELERSIPLLEEAHDAQCRLLGMEHADAQQTQRTLAIQLLGAGRVDEAARLTEWNVRLTRETYGSRHLLTADALEISGKLAFNVLRDVDRAWIETVEALDIRRAALPQDHPDVLDLWIGLGLMKKRRGDAAAAIELFQRAVSAPADVLERTGLMEPATHLLANTCLDSGRFADAAWALELRAAWLERSRGTDDPRTIKAVQETGLVLWRLGRHDVAAERLRTADERWARLDAAPPDERRRAYTALIDICQRAGRAEEAATWHARLESLEDTPKPPATDVSTSPSTQE